MKRSTDRNLRWVVATLIAAALILLFFQSCTSRQEAAARAAGAAAGTVFGLPPVVGDSLVGAVLLLTHGIAAKMGHRRGGCAARARATKAKVAA